jgi:hypothetical protein
MALEFIRFIGGCLILLVPGIWLAAVLGVGRDRLERWTYGSCLGLALAVYFSSAISHLDLRWFYSLWAVFAVACVLARLRKHVPPGAFDFSQRWLFIILIVVAVSRFAVALPDALPGGTFDPTFHLILARKIQLAHHSISDWSPFESAALNYPTGSHTLIVILSGLTGLPLTTVFKDLIPLLGVVSTAQIYVFARRATTPSSASTKSGDPVALFSAAAYGLWAWYGSIDYYRWGGLPNELAMLLFIAMLSLWLDDLLSWSRRLVLMAVLYAAVILVHHHVMLTSGLIIAMGVLHQIMFHDPSGTLRSWKLMILAVVVAGVLDFFFVISYAAKLPTLHSTAVWRFGEPMLNVLLLPREMGVVLCLFALTGFVLHAIGRSPCHPLIVIASIAMVALFVGTEYGFPILLRLRGLPESTAFTPSRFLGDLAYFSCIFAGLAVAYIQRLRRIPTGLLAFLMVLAGLINLPQWINMVTSPQPPEGFIRACDWIQHNTPSTTIVNNLDYWTTYLAWRRADLTPIPFSEPYDDLHPQMRRIPLIASGQIPPDSPDQTIVVIADRKPYDGERILWQDPSGLSVIQQWPTLKSSTRPYP